MSRVAQLVHGDGRKLAVYVPRPSGVGSALAYDLPALKRAADLVLVSTYNEHAPGTSPGPIDSHDGFERVLQQGSEVSRARVAPILGAFGYAWPSSGGPGRLLPTVEATRGRSGCNTGGATMSVAASVASMLTGSGAYACNGETVYYATLEGLRARARAVGAAGFRWVALFSLGREPRAFWDGMPVLRGPGSTR